MIGMLAGENGPGGIDFHDFRLANLLGSLALAVILFDGGLRTRVGQFRVGLWPAVSTVGVVITALLVGAFASWIFRLDWLGGLLVGAIVASTDAAAVFSLLHARGIELKDESARRSRSIQNQQTIRAVFLTISVVEPRLGQDRPHLVDRDDLILEMLSVRSAAGSAGARSRGC